ncbi:putative immunity protein [Streptantibioticus ferralitis]|uniref:Transposase n=1 Tax=Streptantibioticus ferralitis TaxID=236510 RepID=A0ABT5Z979_9ACTN|nr:hypothetical protein [Streptantibioticus ferralitis]MDF2260207.1 hypothetical protein [Streptantibioticus ferralitis]
MNREPGPLTLSEEDSRVVDVWAADRVERTLLLSEAQAPTDTRARNAIKGVRRVGAMAAR